MTARKNAIITITNQPMVLTGRETRTQTIETREDTNKYTYHEAPTPNGRTDVATGIRGGEMGQIFAVDLLLVFFFKHIYSTYPS